MRLRLKFGSERAVSAWAWRVVGLQGLVDCFGVVKKVEGEILGMLRYAMLCYAMISSEGYSIPVLVGVVVKVTCSFGGWWTHDSL